MTMTRVKIRMSPQSYETREIESSELELNYVSERGQVNTVIEKADAIQLEDGLYYFRHDVVMDCFLGRQSFKGVCKRGVVGANMRTGWFSEFAPNVIASGHRFMTREIAALNGVTLCNDCGEFHGQNECAYDGSSIGSYHSLERKNLSGDSRYKVGMEVEKEDYEVKESLNFRKVFSKTGWCIERDGSLNSDGFEAISPVLDLMDIETLEAHMESMKSVMNARYTTNCGGHIHVSDTNRNPAQLFEDCSGYFPLLYAMYPARAKRGYSLAVAKSQMRNAHKNAIMVHNRTLEFRIFPTPKNIEVQKFRLELLRIMLENPTSSYDKVIEMMTSPNSRLFKHLATQYSETSKYIEKLALTIKMTKEIERVDLSTNLTEAESKIKEALKREVNKKKLFGQKMKTQEQE